MIIGNLSPRQLLIYFFRAFTAFTFLALLIDVFVYPGVSRSIFKFDSRNILLVYLILSLPASAIVSFLPKSVEQLNRKYLLPLLLLLMAILFTIENNHYLNYVYSRFHVDIYYLSFLTIFSGSLSYIFYQDYAKKRALYHVVAPLTLILMYVVVMVSPKLFIFLVQEDGISETGQFLFYLISGIFAFRASLIFRKKNKLNFLLFLLFGIGMLFVAFEEISWGQRIFGIETPEKIKELNHQDEITIHNLNFFQQNYLHLSFVVAGFYGAFSRLVVDLLPSAIRKKLLIYTPPKYLFFSFFAPFALYALYNSVLVPNEVSVGNVPLGRWQEVFEIYMGLGFMGYSLYVYKSLKRNYK